MEHLFLIGNDDCKSLLENGRFDPINTTIMNVKGIKSDEIFAELKQHKCVYVFSDLKPNPDFTIHSGNLFNHIMYNMIENSITGKKIVIMRDFNLVQWSELRKNFVSSVFRGNDLYYYKGGEEVKIDIDKLVNEELI